MKLNYYWATAKASGSWRKDLGYNFILKIKKIENNHCLCIIYEYVDEVEIGSPNFFTWKMGPRFPLKKTFSTGQISEKIRLKELKPMQQHEIAEALLRMMHEDNCCN